MNKKLLSIIFLVTMNSSIMAQEFINTPDYHALKEQVNNQNFTQAWEMAQLNADEYLGDADFDFLYGLAALKNNNVELAVFAFERVVTNKPAWLDGQYYLAQSYFKMANYHAVISLCQAIIAQPNSADKLVAASDKLQQAAQRKLAQQSLYFQQYASVGAGYDSNINAGIDEENIFLPFLGQTIALSDSSKENSDNYLTLNYRLNGSQALTQKSKLLFSAKANIHRFISESDFNRMILDGSVSYQQQFEEFDACIGIRVQPLWFSGDYYRTQASVDSKIKKQLSQQWLIAGDLSLGQTKNNVNKTLDTDDLLLSASSQYFTGSWRHSIALSYLEAMSQDKANDHISSKSSLLSYNGLWIINSHWLASGTLSFQHQSYQDLHPFYFTKRVDNMLSLAAMVQFQQSKDVSYQFNMSVQDKDSNLSLFSYQRIDIGLSASLNF
ncbi:MAG: surface lipoprotein assembly modifier [Colwellia sp.]|nr:surface lipoprotein assembly modifier [Colwellia sp.]